MYLLHQATVVTPVRSHQGALLVADLITSKLRRTATSLKIEGLSVSR